MNLAQHTVRSLGFFLVCWLTSAAYSQSVVINEFMASNTGSVTRSDGKTPDWIELYNPSAQDVDLSGMYLTDDANDLTQWQFPANIVLGTGQYLTLWADQKTPETELHTNFSLNADGEALVLVAADGQTVVDEVTFGPQLTDYSWGRSPDGNDTWLYMDPTFGQPNGEGFAGLVEPVQFSVERGFFDQGFTLTLSCATEGATILYGTDFKQPLLYAYSTAKIWIGNTYDSPLSIDHTTVVRAVAIKDGWKASSIMAQTYIFPEDVIHQPAHPDGFPTSWGGRTVDYAMDPRIVNDPAYSSEIKDDLLSTPSVCLTVDNDDLFGNFGIYSHPAEKGDDWERKASMEWIDPNTGDTFGVNAGLRIQGGDYARTRSTNPKSGLQLFFRAEYGSSKLKYPILPDNDVQQYDRLALREIWNYSWIGDSGSYGADYLRDCFARDTVRDLGRLTPHGRPVQLYINGLYWGLYIMAERVDNAFAAEHLGGNKEDYDVLEAPSNQGGGTTMKVDAGGQEATDAWETLFALADQDLSDPNNVQTLQNYVDIPAMIDYMLMIYYTGSRDGPVFLGDQRTPRNFYAVRSANPAEPFLFVPWDVEWSLENPQENRVSVVGVWQPHYLMDKLAANSEFKIMLADMIHQRFFNNGVLTAQTSIDRYLARADSIRGAIVGESARWGDVKRNQPYTREDWQNEVDRLVNEFFSVRTDVVLNQLRNYGWYPLIDAPVFQINDVNQPSGQVDDGSVLTLVNPNDTGTIYYTLDGSDPRQPMAQQGQDTSWTLIPENAEKHVWVPTEDIGTDWQGGNEPFDDQAWNEGTITQSNVGGVGYERSSGYQNFITTDIGDVMYGQNSSCYIRIPFTLSADILAQINTLNLNVRCDDGFVAYLNGVEVASINKPGNLQWNSNCANRPDTTDLVTFQLSNYMDALHVGNNILAVHGLNQSITSSDFLFSVILEGQEHSSAQISPTALTYTDPITLTEAVHVKARVFNGDWSALQEGTFSTGDLADGLRVSELMYHPKDPNTEFIELTNIADHTIGLNGVRFTHGIDFTFPSLSLAPGDTILVVEDENAFNADYGVNLPVVGQYTGSLSNGGEHIRIEDALGISLIDFRYDDNWYPITDGSGYSLTATVTGLADPNTLSDPNGWTPSSQYGGTPGY